jgi:uncharacterized membrane protein YphA (DoxX/SURF4 family)
MAIALLAVRCILVCVFLRAGLAKISAVADFRLAVANYGLLPPRAVPAVAAGLPFAETLAAVLLGLGVLAVPVAALLAVLLIVFAAAIAVNLVRGRVFDCGCAGAAPSKIGWEHVAINITLALLAAAIALAPPRDMVLFPGVHGLFSVSATGTNTLPVAAATVLCFVMAGVIRGAMSVYRLAGSLPDQAHPPVD